MHHVRSKCDPTPIAGSEDLHDKFRFLTQMSKRPTNTPADVYVKVA
jgi:hypothetical protein